MIGSHTKPSSAQWIACFSRSRASFHSHPPLVGLRSACVARNIGTKLRVNTVKTKLRRNIQQHCHPARDIFGCDGSGSLPSNGGAPAEKLHSALPRVYDNIITSYASPEVRTSKPQPC
ncbi:hypothetical protein NK6_6381 [Bradyrhizobium diazoefficiens]|uniref:Uncharacterized protein n=1 Tax=Bradyrhizobium diazoefficiens TaxID=1355477 RepID=A0A0E4FW41_9BRAD|nr:hypothetical protein NK6_6381 [Bradyrhizobium diazoefficiens]